ncbi:hypothetical protein QBC38DRAFT_467143 [Podospora fimiseda]|uniref:J domain-containing protein n=1 Tax=Podospora fimiseda TaxID=252190 RepID=A0AAN7BX14_9PEZI|nr:hypothetical protein QBC38DRAFT_467143 [Podospora fimiseda]
MNILEQPEKRDYYADLGGLSQSATADEIKAAWFKLAKKHHPDKKAPGKPVDAAEFRRIREAYDCLRDPPSRLLYDAQYPKIKSQWTQYRTVLAILRKQEAQKRAEAAATAKAKTEAEARQKKLAEQKRQEAVRLKLQARLEKERLAEERSREAGRRLSLQHKKEAQDRLRFEQLEQEREQREEEEAALRKQKWELARLKKEAEALKQKQEEEQREKLRQQGIKERKVEFKSSKEEPPKQRSILKNTTTVPVSPSSSASSCPEFFYKTEETKKLQAKREAQVKKTGKRIPVQSESQKELSLLIKDKEKESLNQQQQQRLKTPSTAVENLTEAVRTLLWEKELAKRQEEFNDFGNKVKTHLGVSPKVNVILNPDNHNICEHLIKWVAQKGVVDMCSRCDVIQSDMEYFCPRCHASFCAECKDIEFANL